MPPPPPPPKKKNGFPMSTAKTDFTFLMYTPKNMYFKKKYPFLMPIY